MYRDSAFTNWSTVLIIGNGFDLNLGLSSSFSSFFRKEILDANGAFKEDERNLLLYLLFLRFFYQGNPSNTFFKTIYADNPNWMDVEGFLKLLATNHSMIQNIHKAMSFRKHNVVYPSNTDIFVLMIGYFLSKLGLPEKQYDINTIINLLDDNLKDFELRFLAYLKSEVGNRDEYAKKQEAFIDKILNTTKTFSNNISLRVVSFNYTKNSLNLYSEINVHGSIDTNIVIGYDSTQKAIAEDDLFVLSKDWRKNNIEFKSDLSEKYIGNIVVYGHSLGEQDYPYFFEIFDRCLFLDDKCDVKLYLCYSVWENSRECEKALESYRMNATKMLNSYERYKNPSLERNAIITKLKMKNRLQFIEIKKDND